MSKQPGLDARDRLALARAQLLRGWHAGACPEVEQVLIDYPDLTGDSTAVADLAHVESVLRLARGQALDVEALCTRFPSHAEAIRRLLALDPCLVSEQATVAPRPPAAVSRVALAPDGRPPEEDPHSSPRVDAPSSPETVGEEVFDVEVIDDYPRVPGYEILG